MSSNKISKRTFLKNMSTLVGGLFVTKQAAAASILEHMATHQPNKFQADLIKDPKKQQLIAEIAECVGYPPFPNPFKLKCLMGNT